MVKIGSQGYVRTHALARFRWQNGGMARIVPSTLTFTEKRWFTALIKKHQMRPIFLRKKLPQGQAQSWRNLYLDEIDPAYAKTLAPPNRMNAIGWHCGKPVFIFLRGQISPVLRHYSFFRQDIRIRSKSSPKSKNI